MLWDQLRFQCKSGADAELPSALRVQRLLDKHGVYQNLFTLQYLFDLIVTAKSAKLGKWATSNEASWSRMHKTMWPDCKFPGLVQRGLETARRPERGPPELAKQVEKLSCSTSVLFSILVWAVRSDNRTPALRRSAAQTLAGLVNSFIRSNALLPAEGVVFNGLESLGWQPGRPSNCSLTVSKSAMCKPQALLASGVELGTNCEAHLFKNRWIELVRDKECSQWLTHSFDNCSFGELMSVCLLGSANASRIGKLGLDLATQFAALFDSKLEGCLETCTVDNMVMLKTASGNLRRPDAGHRQALAADVADLKKRPGPGTIEAHKQRLLEKEARTLLAADAYQRT